MFNRQKKAPNTEVVIKTKDDGTFHLIHRMKIGKIETGGYKRVLEHEVNMKNKTEIIINIMRKFYINPDTVIDADNTMKNCGY
jgi:hypothetical protein